MNPHILRLGAACLAALSLAACDNEPAQKKGAGIPQVDGQRLLLAPDDDASFIKTAAAARDPGRVLRLPGRLVWNEEKTVRVLPPLPGRVAEIRARIGDRVRAGQTLAVLHSADFGQAWADLKKAEADARLAGQALARQRELHAAGVAAAKDLEQAEAENTRAAGELERARAGARLLGGSGQGQAMNVISPLAGTVVERAINPGQEAKADNALFVVSDPSSLWVQFDVPELDIAALRAGTTVDLEVASWPGERFSARVLHVADFIDPSTRMTRAAAAVDNSERRLKAEMYATGHLAVPGSGALAVPAAAVFLQGGRHYVLVELGPRQYERRPVEAGHESQSQGGKLVQITGGLREGEKVVVEGNLHLIGFFKAAQ